MFRPAARRPSMGIDLEDVAVVSPSVMLGVSGRRDLIIEGRIDAQVALHAQNVSIGPKGSVSADVHGARIRVAGRVTGNLFGDVQVVIRRTGSVRGNISAPSVVLEDGADFKGNIEMGTTLGYNGGGSRSAESPRGGPVVTVGRPPPAGVARMPSDDTRAAIRIEKRLEIEYASDCPPIRANVEDLSETGMYLDTGQPLPAGSELEFDLYLPDGDASTPLSGKAVVVWSGPTGMGVEFRELPEADSDRLRFFVASVLFDQPPDLPTSE